MAATNSPEELSSDVTRADACEAVVVGAGLVGAALAANLATEGVDVGVLDARGVASGATGYTAGLVPTGLPTFYARAVEKYGREMARAVWQLTVDNRTRLISAAEGRGLIVDHPGSLVVATNGKEADLLMASAEMLKADGFDISFQDGDPLGRGFTAALTYPDDVVVDTAVLTQSLLDGLDVPVHPDTEVYGLVQDGDDVLVLARGRTVRARIVVLAVNAYAPLIDAYFPEKIAPVRGYTLVTQPLDAGLIPTPGCADSFLFRQSPDGRLLFTSWPNHYETPAAGPNDERADVNLMQFVGHHFPEAANRFSQRQHSMVGISSDGLPLIGALPHLPQVFFAVGFAGCGLSLIYAAADLLAALITRGAEPELLSARRLE